MASIAQDDPSSLPGDDPICIESEARGFLFEFYCDQSTRTYQFGDIGGQKLCITEFTFGNFRYLQDHDDHSDRRGRCNFLFEFYYD